MTLFTGLAIGAISLLVFVGITASWEQIVDKITDKIDSLK